MTLGRDSERYSPEAYGHYVATNTAVYACSNLRAKNLAKLPIRIYKRAANGERVEVQSGRLFDLLQSVNPHWTFRRLIRMTEMTLTAYGQCFWILENGVNAPITTVPPKEIWWAHPSKMRVVPHPEQYVSGFIYEDGATKIPFAANEVIWFRYDNPADEYAGLSPIAAARQAIETAHGAIASNRAVFTNGMQLSGVMGPADKTQNLSREQAETLAMLLERRFRGAEKAHRVAVLTQPVAFTPMSLTPKDVEFLGMMKWGMREVCTVFGVPPELVGDHEHATYSNIESAMKSLWTDTLIPEASMIADELTEQLVPLFGKEADEVEFDLSDIETLQEDRGEVIEQVVKLVGVGVPLNRALQELAPRFLPPEGQGFPWGDAAWMNTTVMSPVTEETMAALTAAPTPPILPSMEVSGSATEVPSGTATDAPALPPPSAPETAASGTKAYRQGGVPGKDGRRS
jgi:HK97 family phage portal protein